MSMGTKFDSVCVCVCVCVRACVVGLVDALLKDDMSLR
jgi:hypothetical protein